MYPEILIKIGEGYNCRFDVACVMNNEIENEIIPSNIIA